MEHDPAPAATKIAAVKAPAPWRINRFAGQFTFLACQIHDTFGHLVATAETPELAARIVAMANAHADEVAAAGRLP